MRFDIDTIRCMRLGVPALLTLARELECSFTFFVNMGQSVTRTPWSRKTRGSQPVTKLSVGDKLGLRDLITTLAFNPRVGARSPLVLRQAQFQGHELGLHGGSNHGLWQHHAMHWDRSRVEKEVTQGLMLMRRAGLSRPSGFASPGFTQPLELHTVLRKLEFDYVADGHLPGEGVVATSSDGLLKVNTNILGMPGNIGYLEWCMANGMNEAQMVTDFRQQLSRHQHAVMYDHPVVAGGPGLKKVRLLVHEARRMGWKIVTLQQMLANTVRNEN
ncbi:MAG: DUF2334 domain-containing protein [Gammaproteobacteria bacterium]